MGLSIIIQIIVQTADRTDRLLYVLLEYLISWGYYWLSAISWLVSQTAIFGLRLS